MFGLFGKKREKPSVSAEDKSWIEKNMLWFIEIFGFERIRDRPFISLNDDSFTYSNLKQKEQVENTLGQICDLMEIDPKEILVKFFDDYISKPPPWQLDGLMRSNAGLYSTLPWSNKEKRYLIELAKSTLSQPQYFVSVVAHEFAHIKLLGGLWVADSDEDMEPLTDLASIYFGFGIFTANSFFGHGAASGAGYLTADIISYANALLCHISKQDPAQYLPMLNSNTKKLFTQNINFLKKTDDTFLTAERIAKAEEIYQQEHKNRAKVLSAFIADLESGYDTRGLPQEAITDRVLSLNNLGYALIALKKYAEAINYFSRSINIFPEWDFPYNNRGYCHLQLGNTDAAFADISKALELNPENSFAWRNLGAFYLATSEAAKALAHFEKAKEMKMKPELINFYLGQAHLKLNNLDQAEAFFKLSKELKEHNDSVLSDLSD